ncbi:MAG: hypothetical protein ACRYGI_02060 [Janthinobacterium lividum]
MPVAQQDQWQQDMLDQTDGGIFRLQAALARIAAAVGRKQDELRVAELTAQAAQHEADMLARSQVETEAKLAAAASRPPQPAPGLSLDEMQSLSARLDAMIASVQAVIGPEVLAAADEQSAPASPLPDQP